MLQRQAVNLVGQDKEQLAIADVKLLQVDTMAGPPFLHEDEKVIGLSVGQPVLRRHVSPEMTERRRYKPDRQTAVLAVLPEKGWNGLQ